MRQVFISYRQESDDHSQAVRELAERLRAAGLQVALDQFYEEENPGGPNAGWSKWCEDRVTTSAAVLVVASPGWFDAYSLRKKRSKPLGGNGNKGLGAAWEAGIIREEIVRRRGNNPKIRFVELPSVGVLKYPEALVRWHRFFLSGAPADANFEGMVRWLQLRLKPGAPSKVLPKSSEPKPPRDKTPTRRKSVAPAVTDHKLPEANVKPRPTRTTAHLAIAMAHTSLSVAFSADGRRWPDPVSLSGEETGAGCALAAFQGKLWMAFIANNSSRQILISSSSDGVQWSKGTGIEQWSRRTPALAAFDNKLWAAFLANNKTDEILVCSSTDGREWLDDFRIRQWSRHPPALTEFNGRLWMAFIAHDSSNEILVCSSEDGSHWTDAESSGESSSASPALVAFQGQLWLAFVANDARRKLRFCSSPNGKAWTLSYSILEMTNGRPTLVAFQDRLQVAFPSRHTHRVLLCSSPDGSKSSWSSAKQIYTGPADTLALTVFDKVPERPS